MKRLAESLILSLGLTFLFATGAAAQIVVSGVVKPEDIPGMPTDEVLGGKRPTSQPWSMTLGVHEVFESNVLEVPGGNGDLGSRLDAGIARSWALQRGAVNVVGNAGETFYRQSSSPSQFLYGVGLSASYQVSARVSLSLGDTLSTAYAEDTIRLKDSGLLPPKTLTHLNNASGELRYQVSPRTEVRWGLAEQNVSFGSSQYAGASQVAGASTLTTRVSISRQVTRSETLGVREEFQRAITQGTAGIIEGLFGTWQQTIGKSAAVSAAAGLRVYTLPGASGLQTAPGVSAAFTDHLRHDDVLGLSYERSIEYDGSHLSDQVWATYGLSLTRHLVLDTSANYGRGYFPLDPNYKRFGETGILAVRYVLPQNLSVSVGYALYVRTESPNPAVSGHRTMMSLTYGRKWG